MILEEEVIEVSSSSKSTGNEISTPPPNEVTIPYFDLDKPFSLIIDWSASCTNGLNQAKVLFSFPTDFEEIIETDTFHLYSDKEYRLVLK